MTNNISVNGSAVSWTSLFDRSKTEEPAAAVETPVEEAPPEAAVPGSSRALYDLFASLPASSAQSDDAAKAAGAAAVAGCNDWLGQLNLPTIRVEDSTDTSD